MKIQLVVDSIKFDTIMSGSGVLNLLRIRRCRSLMPTVVVLSQNRAFANTVSSSSSDLSKTRPRQSKNHVSQAVISRLLRRAKPMYAFYAEKNGISLRIWIRPFSKGPMTATFPWNGVRGNKGRQGMGGIKESVGTGMRRQK